jgi:hypothetical protein
VFQLSFVKRKDEAHPKIFLDRCVTFSGFTTEFSIEGVKGAPNSKEGEREMQISEVRRPAVSIRAGKTKRSILMAIALLATMSLAPARKVNAQVVECLGRCEQQLAVCVASGGGQQFNAGCYDDYEACANACVGLEVLLG